MCTLLHSELQRASSDVKLWQSLDCHEQTGTERLTCLPLSFPSLIPSEEFGVTQHIQKLALWTTWRSLYCEAAPCLGSKPASVLELEMRFGTLATQNMLVQMTRQSLDC